MLASASYAQICEVDTAKEVLRKNLYLHLTSSSSPIAVNEVIDLLTFYLTIAPGLVTVDCSGAGTTSGSIISNIINNGEGAPNVIPACSDGTKYGECSATKPGYCYGGSLINKCNSCGCPSGNSCSNNNCNPAGGNITCFTDLDCGSNQFTGNYYCVNSNITRNYLQYTCTNPGTASSSCVSSANPVALSYCNPFLNQTCVGGSASCQVTASDVISPNVSITSPANSVTVSGLITVSAAASDNIAVAGVQFRVDSFNTGTEDTTFPYSITWNSSTVTNGNHAITAVARDSSGNTATSQGININVSNVLNDTSSPVLSNGQPTGTLTAGTTQTILSLTTNENANCRYSITSGTAYASMTNTFSTTGLTSHSTNLTNLSNGQNYTRYVRCQDTAGNANTNDYAISFSVASTSDTTLPNISITSPISGSNVSGSITISAAASDNVGVVGVQFRLDGINLSLEDTISPYSILWSTTTTTNSAHNLTAVARDAAGNTRTSTGVIVTVSNPTNQNPVADIFALPTSGTAPLLVDFLGNYSYDPDGFITSYNWTFGDGAQSTLPVVTHNYTTPGIRNATLRVIDNNGTFGIASQLITVT